MTAATDDTDARPPPRRASPALVPAPVADLVSYVDAAAFVVAAAWYGLTARFITVAKPPAFNPDTPLDAELHRWFNWFMTHPPAGAPRRGHRDRRLPVPGAARRLSRNAIRLRANLARFQHADQGVCARRSG